MRSTTRRGLLVLVALLALAGLVPLLRAGETHRQAAWEARCVGSGGSVSTRPPPTDNPLVVQLRRPAYECRSATGVLVSQRD